MLCFFHLSFGFFFLIPSDTVLLGRSISNTLNIFILKPEKLRFFSLSVRQLAVTLSSQIPLKSLCSSLTYMSILTLSPPFSCVRVFTCIVILHISPFPLGRNKACINTTKYNLGTCHRKCFSS